MENIAGSCILWLMRAFVIAVLLLSPITTSFAADGLEYLMDDADRFEEDLLRMQQQADWDTDDRKDLSSSDLLPVDASAPSGERIVEESNDLPFVRIRIDGIPIDLSDVPRDGWFAPYVRAAADSGIVSGYRSVDGRPLGLFGPADAVTIEQLAKIAANAAGIDRSACGQDILNIGAKGRWSEEYLRCAESLRWAVYADGSVDPARPATRMEVVVTVLQAYGVTFRDSDATPFTDVDSSIEFRTAIITAYEDHIVGGYTDASGAPTGKFGPADPVNRAEIAKIIVLSEEVYGQ